jgi:hypothetical protein
VAILSTRGVTTVTWVADLAAPTGERARNTALDGQVVARSLGERLFDSPAQGPAVVLIAALGGALAIALAIALWRAGRIWRWLILGGGALLVLACVVLGIGGLGLFLGGGAMPMSMEATQVVAEEPAEEEPAPAEEEMEEEPMEEVEVLPVEPTEAAIPSTSTPIADEPETTEEPTGEPEPTQEVIEVIPPGGEGESEEEAAEEEPAVGSTSEEMFTFVEAEWPERMGRGDSGVVRIRLTRRTEESLEVTVEVEGNVGEATLIEVPEGATGDSLETAFGPEYRALAVANLESAGLDVRRSSAWAAYQPLSRESVQWAWFVSPLSTGDQTMVATVSGLWEPVDEPDACAGGSDSCIERELWYAILETRVRNPLIETGQLNLLSIVTGVLGSSVSIPWLVERAQGVFGRRAGGGIA